MLWEPGGTLPRPRRVVEESGVAFADFIGWSTRSFDEANSWTKKQHGLAKDPPFWSNFYTMYFDEGEVRSTLLFWNQANFSWPVPLARHSRQVVRQNMEGFAPGRTCGKTPLTKPSAKLSQNRPRRTTRCPTLIFSILDIQHSYTMHAKYIIQPLMMSIQNSKNPTLQNYIPSFSNNHYRNLRSTFLSPTPED